ncbi:hypothetical protein L0337_12500 [candidate division KSB1 bacterium]|nr:hypothetical protein [candidate division KSB1 bacterium]
MRKPISIATLITAVALFFLLSVGYGQNLKKLERLEKEKKEIKYLSAGERHELMQELRKALRKTLQDDPLHETLKETIITGNQIRVLLTNQGSISTPDADNANADLVWPQGANQLGYAYEFGPLVGAEVPHAFIPDSMVHIVNDGFLARADGDFQPGTTTRWGWLPRVGFSDPNSKEVATFSDLDSNLDGKPDSWPQQWYNETLGRYVWPAFLGNDATTPDEEVFYVMDDFNNAEFAYYPFPDDSSRRGLGLELQVRIFQFNNPLAEDIIFLVYTITNTSPKTLDKIFLGMFGDPHVGGPNDFADDNGAFISAFNEAFPFNTRNMLYALDANGRGDGGKIPGYFGYRFLESPGIVDDGFDNDNDDLIDESPFNDAGAEIFGPVGIYGEPKLHWSGDEDGDWDVRFDDVGVDGIAGTGDLGEGDGRPTQLYFFDLNNNGILDFGEPISESRLEGMRFRGGEPNFGFLDIAESDQLGLTSFNAILFGGNNRPNNDELMWRLMSTPNQRPGDPEPTIEQESDNVFIYGSGPFRLRPGESQRFSIALLLGENLDDLLQNAEISQQVFESDYRFAKPPDKPKLVAVPGDKKVTLYWDTGAESSFDPFVARANPDDANKGFDFEGYRIYRSQDFSFNDTKTITDSRGIPFLSVPLKQANGVPAQFDLINEFSGLSAIEYRGRGIRFDLGNNTGLRHSFVDSNNVINGATYYYAVTSYDHGDLKGQLAPSESQRTIQRDALTRQFTFDVNTARVVPGPPASGFAGPGLTEGGDLAARVEGNATGAVRVQVLDPFAVMDGKNYEVIFEQVGTTPTSATGYSVVDLQQKKTTFIARDTLSVNLLVDNLVEGSVTITSQAGAVVDPADYSVDYKQGRIRGARPGALPSGQNFRATYRFKPVAESTALSNEDSNPVFDGVRVFVQNEATALDLAKSGFKVKESNTNLLVETIGLATVGSPRPYPSDFEIHFANYDTAADGRLTAPADTSVVTNVAAPFKIFDAATGRQIDFFINETNPRFRNRRWDWQETIVLLEPNAPRVTNTTYQVKFAPPSDTVKSADGTRDSLITFDPPIYPRQGDVFLFFSKKPFDPGDKYAFTTRAVTFETQQARDALADVYVVPNPYIAFSAAETAAPRSGERDDRRLEFRNLPQRCTIRIYTITGELVDTIEKDDNRDFAVWDLLTFESQQTAYGVYIYHVDAPNVGTKIGRFALIK